MGTGSNSAIASAIRTIASWTSTRSLPHTSAVDGQHIQVRSCGSSSDGILQPDRGSSDVKLDVAGPDVAEPDVVESLLAQPASIRAPTSEPNPTMAARRVHFLKPSCVRVD
jgi:hypothetical protein